VHSLRALRYRDYRIFLLGQGVALIGTWCQRVAISWLVYRTTGSAVLLGVVAFAAEICFLFIAPFGGLIADRVRRAPALIVVQAISALQAFTLALLVWLGWADVGWIAALALLLGACQAVEMPLRQAMFSDLVTDPADLPNAIALMAFMNNAGRLVGPIIAGLVIGVAGEDLCIAINGLGYVFVIVALLNMHPRQAKAAATGGPVLADLREGFAYAWHHLPIRATLGLLAMVGLCYLPYLVIVPVFTHDVLHGDARMLGFLLSAAGMGAVGGLVWIATSANADTVPRMLSISATVGGVGILVLATGTSFVPVALSLAAVGFGIVVTATGGNVYLQSIAAPGKRGRVLGLFTMCFLGVAPIGNLLVGVLVERAGSRWTLLLLGAVGLLCTALFQHQRPRMQAVARAAQ
jgi:MFS family permease